MNISSIKGFADLYPEQSELYTHMENLARNVFSRFGYAELRTPIVEYTDLFCRSIGTETDVVQKEMYSFPDRKNRSLTLRPEATAGVMRSYIQSKQGADAVHKYFTYGPMFRYERPQKGRMRQFHQLNCECLGSSSAHTDAELIVMLMHFLSELEVGSIELQINTLGCSQCRPQYRNKLTSYLHELDSSKLCADCLRRVDINPLRVLDCKIPTCKELTENAPRIDENVCPECAKHFDVVLNLLDSAKLAYVRNARLVRGLDYYSRTTFEVVSHAVGSQSSIAGGGRYDGLVKQLGGSDVPGLGFACGMERLAMLMKKPESKRPFFHVVHMGDDALQVAFAVSLQLRRHGYCGDMAHNPSSFKSQMRQADKANARFVLILGEDECKSQSVAVKNMDDGQQEIVKIIELVSFLDKFSL